MQQVVFILLVYFTLLNLCFSSYLFYCSPYYVIFAYLLFLPFQVFYCHLHSFLCCFSSAHIPIFVVSVIFFSHLYYHGLLAILIHTTHCFLGFMCVYCFYIFHFSIMIYVYFINFRTAALIQVINSLSERGIKYCIITSTPSELGGTPV